MFSPCSVRKIFPAAKSLLPLVWNISLFGEDILLNNSNLAMWNLPSMLHVSHVSEYDPLWEAAADALIGNSFKWRSSPGMICFRQMDINEGKVPWQDAIPRKAQDSADYNHSAASPAGARVLSWFLAWQPPWIGRGGAGRAGCSKSAAGSRETWAVLGLILVTLLDRL